MGVHIPHGQGQFWGEGRPIVNYKDTLRSSVQKRLNWSRCRLGRRKHNFNRIRQVAPMCPPARAH